MSASDVTSDTANVGEAPDGCLAFVMNVRRFADFTSAELAPGHILRPATDAETDEIRTAIQRLSGSGHEYAWEMRWSDDREQTEALPRESWRYFVIGFRGNNATMNTLADACDLSTSEPEVGPVIMRGFIPGAVVNFHPARLFHSMEPTLYDPDFFIELCTLDVAEITEIHRRLVAHDDSLIDLKHVTLQLGQLKALPRSSLLRFLGYFGILESLLTHPPRQSDPYDSITRQVRKKLVLLNGRFSRPPDYAVFGGTPVETIWTRMYAYRSQIAHGGPARIEGDLEVLGNHKKALALLRATTKAVARQALFEPQLVRDLREC